MVIGKAAEYKVFWTGNQKGFGRIGLSLAKKLVD